MSLESGRFLVMTPMLSGRDGISEVSRQIVRGLVSDVGADRVATWALDGATPVDTDRVPSHAIRLAQGSRRRFVQWALADAMRSNQDLTVVVLHLHLAPVAALLRPRGARMVVFLHGVEAWHPLRPRERAALAAADRVVANSARTVSRFRTANPWWGTRPVGVALLGIDVADDSHVPADERGFALIVGRLSSDERYKGHDALIDAWPQIRAAVPDARLIIVGDGDDRSRLEQRVRDGGLAGAIRFTGRVSNAELRGLYRACSLFVMPSSGEGFGLAYLEAMREGKPCIALRTANEIIDDGVTGLLLDDAEPGALATAVSRVLSDRALRERLGSAAAQRVATTFTEHHFLQRFQQASGIGSVDRKVVPAGAADVHA